MQFLFVALIVLHVLVCFLLILLVLLQNDKGGGLASAFGGMGGSAAFSGSSTATFLTKITWWFAIGSFAIILGLNNIATKGTRANLKESELKSARKGLSSVLPAAPVGSAPAGAIPGLGTVPTAPEAPQEAPAGGAPGTQGK